MAEKVSGVMEVSPDHNLFEENEKKDVGYKAEIMKGVGDTGSKPNANEKAGGSAKPL